MDPRSSDRDVKILVFNKMTNDVQADIVTPTENIDLRSLDLRAEDT
jgi:hypothetical protein